MIKIFSLLFLGLGVFVLVQVVMPLAAFKFWELTTYQNETFLVDPHPPSTDVLGVSVENVNNFPAIISDKKRAELPYSNFSLEIPKINLDWPKVQVDSNTFEENLGHLPGSALPGERGNVFITGHSSLSGFYKQGNYKAVFAHLPEIKKGDEIVLKALGQDFRYIVEGSKIVDPKDLSVIEPPDDSGRYLTLMTCVPPGLNVKRLIVLARLK